LGSHKRDVSIPPWVESPWNTGASKEAHGNGEGKSHRTGEGGRVN